MIREAMLYERIGNARIRCFLCAHRCIINAGKRGICGVRENRDGALYSLVYGEIVAENVDPIEKKPLFHVHPGSSSFSIAAVGCNLHCRFCQNYSISQFPQESQGRIAGRQTGPADVVQAAIRSGSKTVAYTYTEPTVNFEFALDTARLARKAGLKNIFVTNGYMTTEALNVLSPFLDAANVDLKSFSDRFYRSYCGARLQPVLDGIAKMKELGIWIEITTLVIPGLNDGNEELKRVAEFVCALGSETPWHVSRFYPQYKINNILPTSGEKIRTALQIGRMAGLKYVYAGNIPGDEGENTYCHKCGTLLIARCGFAVEVAALVKGRCFECGTALEGIF